ncbi:MAG: endonuclease III [Buchnera aphidicola (Schlechtendalia peitan)]
MVKSVLVIVNYVLTDFYGIQENRKKLNSHQLNQILFIFSKINPNPKMELKFSSNFELLISVILSAQSTDRMVNKITKTLYQVANTPLSIILLGLDGLKSYIKELGLFNKKSSNIIKTCNILLNKYEGKIPNNIIELRSLPGVGRKTANIILNYVFKKKTIAVDTHVFRVCNRIGFLNEKTVIKTERKLLEIVPEKFKLNFHNWFVLHGRYICRSKFPNCSICSISNLCTFKYKNF